MESRLLLSAATLTIGDATVVEGNPGDTAQLVFDVTLDNDIIPSGNAIIVPGTSNPWLSAMPDGSTALAGDSAPANSPVQVSGTPITGAALTFGVTGSASHVSDPSSGFSPDGGPIYSHSGGAENGIAGITAPLDSLIGVFLDDSQPNSTAVPAGLDFSTSASQSQLVIAPGLKQPFFIGDGLTDTSEIQQFIPPSGATRLFLGTMDLVGWYDNSGALSVTVNPDGPITVDYATSNGTAGDGTGGSDSDYVAKTGTLTFAGTAGEVQQIKIDITEDSNVELDETLSVILSNLQANGGDVTLVGTGTPPVGGNPAVFVSNGQSFGSDLTRQAVLGDLDGDGDLDAFLANGFVQSSIAQTDQVWINQGGSQGGIAGQFIDSGQQIGTRSLSENSV